MAIYNNIVSNEIYNKVKENIYVVLKRSMMKFHTDMPTAASENGVYNFEECFYDDWHVGFWAGIYYMAHEMFGDKTFLNYAESVTETLQQKTIDHTLWESPDEGFIYMPSCVNSFRVNRNDRSIETLCIAADRMVKTHMDADCKSMKFGKTKSGDITNLNLLHLVAGITGDEMYSQIADSIEKCTVSNNIKMSGDCIMETANPLDEFSPYNKLYDVRAIAWILHGLSLRYAGTQKNEYLDMFHKIIKKYVNAFFASVLSQGNSANGKGSRPDTTSMSILNCAIMEITKKLSSGFDVFEGYINILKYNLNYIISEYLISSEKNSQGLVDGGFLTVSSDNSVWGSTVMGDYFFMETLMHLDPEYRSCWDYNYFIKNIIR